jgi:hypothetical protein
LLPVLSDIVLPDIIGLPIIPLGLLVAEAIYSNSADARTVLQEYTWVNRYRIRIELSI